MAVLGALGLIGALAPSGMGAGTAVAGGADPVGVPCDFDGDGYADLAVGVPWEDLRGVRDAGAVQVMYGSASGVTARDQLWHQGRKGIKGALERGDRWGAALACGDFDGDGFADLAVGSPAENVGRVVDAGAVQVLYGGPVGLTARDQIWHQGTPGVPGSNERGDGFGASLAAGDFDGDGFADLAIGSPMEAVGSIPQAGRAVVLRGGPGGLSAAGAQLWRQGLAGLPSQPAAGDRFGDDLAVGDVNGDGYDDLSIAVFAEADMPVGAEGGSSAVHLLLGGRSGLTVTGNQFILATDLLEREDIKFGVTFGDFNRDGRADLVLSSADAVVAVLHGRSNGVHVDLLPEAPTPGADGWWWTGMGEEGLTINAAAGDITGDGLPDLVVERGWTDVNAVLGTDAGLASGSVQWTVPAAEYADIAILPFSGENRMWLAVSHWNRSGPEGAGAVSVLRGTQAGPGPVTIWSQDSPGIKGAAEAGDGFGTVIAR